MKKIKVLSLFNGMNCIGLALSNLGVKFELYAAEIDKHANKVSNALFPHTINLGDVKTVKPSELPAFDLVVAGSPCQGFSKAGNQLNFEHPKSILFFEFVRILNECKVINPNLYFLLENVEMKKTWESIISKYMGIDPIKINSKLLCAQSRPRVYWTNINKKTDNLFSFPCCGIPQPRDKNIFLKDVLESKEVKRKYFCNSKQFVFATDQNRIKKKYTQINGDKAICLLARSYANWCGDYVHDGNINRLRQLTEKECMRLQTIPQWAIDRIQSMLDNDEIKSAQIYKMLGNGWTVDVIAHILGFMK